MDIRTFLFADLVLQICCALGLMLMSRSVPGLKGLRWFAWAYASATVGILAIIFGGATTVAPYADFFGRCLVLLGAVLLTQGIAEFVVPASNTLAWGGGLLLLFAVVDYNFLLAPARYISAIVIFGLAFAAQLLVGVLVLLSHESPGERTASRATAGLLAGIALLSLIRAVAAPLRGIPAGLLVNDPLRFAGVVLYMIFSAGLAFGFVWMMTARLRNQLEQQARTDSLTGLLNRRALEMAGRRELAACRRRGTPLAVLAMDLDRFKNLNDAFGHAAGDAMLAAVARLLTQGLRSTDLVARFGGEEFIAVLPDRDLARAREIAERLRARVEALRVEFESQTLQVSASLGVAAAAGGGESWSDLLRCADRALYAAKQAGRNCVRDSEIAGWPVVEGPSMSAALAIETRIVPGGAGRRSSR